MQDHDLPTREIIDDPLQDVPRRSLRYEFSVVDDSLHYYRSKQDGEDSLTQVANFWVVKHLAVFQFTDGSHPPFHKMLCRHLINSGDGEGTFYLSIDDPRRDPEHLQGFKYLDAEIMVECSVIKTQPDVRALFKEHHALLDAHNMSPDMLACYMVSMPYPTPTGVITRFGRQLSGLIVAGNCAYRNGMVHSHEDVRISIVPKYFEKAVMPMPRSDYPKHIIIPFPHVRYMLGMTFWYHLLPKFFANNTCAAKAVFCSAVMGMQASKIWKGQSGMGHGCPVTWVYGVQHGTGKTEAILAAHSMLGFYNRAVWAGLRKPLMNRIPIDS